MAFKVLLAGQPRFMREHGYNVILISADGIERDDVIRNEGCEHIIVPMTRKITPFKDLVHFFKLRKLIRKYRPDIVHTHTPKAGLLGMLAAKSAGVKIRIHTVAGLPLMIEKGFKRKLLVFTERLTYGAANHVWPNSNSMMNFILSQNLTGKNKLKVIGNGSSNGVDLKKFSKNNLQKDMLEKIAATIPASSALKILCVGRMVKDKGIEELISVFQQLKKSFPLQLILVGPFEPLLDPLRTETMEIIERDISIVHVKWSDSVEYYMSLAHIFVHPSHREGFPNVILQAGAMQLPVVCSDIPGNTDIIRHNETGLVFKVTNEIDLYDKLKYAIENTDEVSKIAHDLHKKIADLYDRERMHEVILENYGQLLR
jgi:glycosyltransferase involved in cell wall biosynthesis